MDEDFTTLRKVLLAALGVLIVAAVLGALYAWYQFGKVGPAPEITQELQAATSTEQNDLQASARALREAAAKLHASGSASSSAPVSSTQLQASQAALQQATAQNSASGSGPSQAQLDASQKALEAAMQTKSQ